MKNLKIKLANDKHLEEIVVISVEKVTKQCRKMPNKNVPGRMTFKVIGPLLLCL